jgi:hypothetical protein
METRLSGGRVVKVEIDDFFIAVKDGIRTVQGG